MAPHVLGLPDPLERRRPRHPHPERSQIGVRKAAIAGISRFAWTQDFSDSFKGRQFTPLRPLVQRLYSRRIALPRVRRSSLGGLRVPIHGHRRDIETDTKRTVYGQRAECDGTPWKTHFFGAGPDGGVGWFDARSE